MTKSINYCLLITEKALEAKVSRAFLFFKIKILNVLYLISPLKLGNQSLFLIGGGLPPLHLKGEFYFFSHTILSRQKEVLVDFGLTEFFILDMTRMNKRKTVRLD